MTLSAFSDKSREPDEEDLRRVLGRSYGAWVSLISAVTERVDSMSQLWGFTSANTGWGLRLKRADRVIMYMTPQSGKFLVSFALGEKAVASAHRARLSKDVLEAIDSAPRYAEGRGFRLEVTRQSQVGPLATLARIKHEN